MSIRQLGRSGGALCCALLLALGACGSLPRELAPPEVRLVGLSLLEATLDGQRFRVGMSLYNPNPLAVPIESLRFSVRLGGEGVLTGQSIESLVLPAQGSETLRLEVRTDLVSSMSRLLALASGPDDGLQYELNGRVTLTSRPPRILPFSDRGLVPLTATMGVR